MPGRIDEAALEVAVRRVSKTSPHYETIRHHLEIILVSNDFRGSRRSQEFLRKVIEYALEGDFDSLKERLLGISVFGRSTTYDTGEDAIVRVTANDVRRRLKQFYANGEPHPVRINLPPGSYIPEFQINEIQMSSADALEQARLKSLETPPVQPPSGIRSEEASTGTMLAPSLAFHKTRLVRIASGLLIAGTLMACGWWLGRRPEGRVQIAATVTPKDYAFYHELLGPIATPGPMGVEIVISDPHVLLYKGDRSPATQSTNFYTRKIIPIPPDLVPALNEDANDDEADFPYHHLEVKTTSFTSAGEAEAAFRMKGLFDALGRESDLTEARFLNWDEARDHHIILLAPPSASSWTNKNLTGSDFIMQHDSILNLHPGPGEQAIYPKTFGHDWLNDYGVIWMSETPSGSRILLLSGLTSAGTEGLGQFLTDPVQMKHVYDQLRARGKSGKIPANWELLLQISARENVPLRVSVVALHILREPSLRNSH